MMEIDIKNRMFMRQLLLQLKLIKMKTYVNVIFVVKCVKIKLVFLLTCEFIPKRSLLQFHEYDLMFSYKVWIFLLENKLF
jgi:hypothetical protein